MEIGDELLPTKCYVNTFDGYTTKFIVNSQERKCVIEWENIHPITVTIPYTTELTPELLRQALESLIQTYECNESVQYQFTKKVLDDSTTLLHVYYNTPFVNVSYKTQYSSKNTLKKSKHSLRKHHTKILENARTLINTMKY